MKKKISKIKRFLTLALIFLFSINSFAAIVSDNDGSAFVTKAEFDALKFSFAKQIDDYNASIDGKIDGAIGSYLSGIQLRKFERQKINNYVPQVYCMKYKTNTETKDMTYKYVRPYINFKVCGWSRWTDYNGTYAWNFSCKPATKLTTGTRVLIQNVARKSTGFNGCAEWKGYAENVSEEQTWSCTDIDYNAKYGWHSNSGGWKISMNRVNPIENTLNTGNNWLIGYLAIALNGSVTEQGADDYTFRIYLTGLNTNYSKLSNQNMIIWKPETYYCFTEYDKDYDYYFDANSISGWTTADTSAVQTYDTLGTIPTKKDATGWTDMTTLFSGFIERYQSWYQSNISPESGYTWCRTDGVALSTFLNKHKDDYIYTNHRRTNMIKGFPWKQIDNWKQLYVTNNDWAAILSKSKGSTSASIITEPSGSTHSGLNGGWPIIEVQKGFEYKYTISFKESQAHVVYGKLEPFATDDPTTESNLIEWTGSTHLKNGNKKIAYCGSGHQITLDFIAQEDGVFYLKWADDVALGSSLYGGGTINLSENIDTVDMRDEM